MTMKELADRLQDSYSSKEGMIRQIRRMGDFYSLRKKGVHTEKHQEIDEQGVPVKNCYLPHLRITAKAYARTWKLLAMAKDAFGIEDVGNMWEIDILPVLEKFVRSELNKKKGKK